MSAYVYTIAIIIYIIFYNNNNIRTKYGHEIIEVGRSGDSVFVLFISVNHNMDIYVYIREERSE